jgi:CTP:phosphocholine cytidylyltransferase-like protein
MNKPNVKYAVRNVADIHGKVKNNQIGIIILGAGCSSRTKYIGNKSLVNIKNVTLIDRQLDILNKTFNKKDIILVTGFEAEKVLNYTKNYNIIKIENENYDKTNISRSIAIGLRACNNDSILLIYGDLFFNKELLNIPYKKESFLICCNTMTDNEVGCTINKNIVENVFYDLPNKWAQISYFTGNELELLKKIVYDRNNDRLFGYEIINKIIDKGGIFKAIEPPNSYSQDIDTIKDLTLIENVIK